MSTINVDELEKALNKILVDYNERLVTVVKKGARVHMAELVAETKRTAPATDGSPSGKDRRRHYRDNITSKKLREDYQSAVYVWYVKGADFRLTHLLEFGHATRNGGRTKAFHFIQTALDPIVRAYIREIEEACENG